MKHKKEEYDEAHLASVANLFVRNLRIPATRVKKGKGLTLPDGTVDFESYLVERTPYTRIFNTSWNRDAVYALSNKGLWLYTYILYNLEQGKDYVQLNHDHYKEKIGRTSDNTFLEAKKELIDACFIASTRYKTVFWINPDVFFPGNRLTRFHDKAVITANK